MSMRIFLPAALARAGAGLGILLLVAACGPSESGPEQAADDAMEEAGDATEEMNEAASRTMEEAGDTAEELGEAARRQAEEAGDEVEEAADGMTDGSN